ncbi:trypsin-like [Diachasmimorpha longicaudata]|uniref:trypsin-like n=1 Tax=Diachasmimorpha longicaudata TaxID=58733 RepID=UPI0030B8C891
MLPITPTNMFFAKLNTIFLIYICFIFSDAVKDAEAQRPERMINAEDALIEEFPSNVFVHSAYKINGSPNVYFCSGSLITLTHVLTAAHCTVYYNKTVRISPYYAGPHQIRVRAGVANVRQRGNDYFVKRIYRHEYYSIQIELNPYSSFDIAILELNKVVELGPTQQIIKLPCFSPEFDDEGILLGAGPTSSDPNSHGTMKKATFKVVPCTNWPEEDVICVRNETVNSTQGDSGSAFIFNDRLSGIMSATPDNRDYYILTDVFKYFNWIVNIVGVPEEFEDVPRVG